MGNKIKTVSTGGGSATGVANDFNNFLQQGLNNGSFGAVGQTQGIGSVINNLLSGGNKSGQGMGNFQNLMSQFSQAPNYSAPQVGGFTPGNTSFGGVDYSQGLGGQASSIQLPGLSLPGQVSSASLPGGGADLSNIVSQIGMRNLLPSVNGNMPQSQANVNTSGASNTPEFDAISKILGNQFTKDLGDIRERYGVSSAGLNAESVYRAQAIPQLNQALSQSALAQRQAGQTDTSLGLQGQGLNLQGTIAGLNSGVAQRGQNLDALSTGRSQDIQTGQLASNQSLQAIQNMLAGRGQDLSAGTTQRGQDVSALLTGQGQNLSAQQSNASNFLQSRGLDTSQLGTISQMLLGQGGLNLSGQQSNASNFLSGQGLLNQYLGTYGNLGLGAGQLNLAGNQLSQQGQLSALSQLFGGYQQANQLGTPQAQTQTYQQPSTFSQIMSGLGGLGQGLGGFMQAFSNAGGLQGLFGGGGGGGVPTVPMGNYGNLSIPGVSGALNGFNPAMLSMNNIGWNGSGGGGY